MVGKKHFAQGTIEDPFRKRFAKRSIAQGTIEYLVVVAVIVVIGLVVATMGVSFLDSTGAFDTVGRISGKISSSGISVTDAVVDGDGDGLISLKNTGSDPFTLTRIRVNGTDNNFDSTFYFGQDLLLFLSDLNGCKCRTGETTKVCDFYFFYTTKGGLAKLEKINLTLDCVDNTDENSGGVETIPPVISLSTPADEASTMTNPTTFTYSASDDSTITSCELIIDGISDQTDSSSPFNSFSKTFSEGTYSWDVNCTDQHGNEGSSTNGPRSYTYASIPAYFASSYGESIYEYPRGMATLSDGNFVVISSNSTYAVTKFDSDGNVVWINSVAGIDDMSAVVVDSQGDIIVAGVYNSTITFGDITLTSDAVIDLFVAKIDKDTNEWLWAITPISSSAVSGAEYSEGLAVDSEDNIILVGTIVEDEIFTPGDNEVTFGSVTLPVIYDNDAFVAKINGDDNSWMWATKASDGIVTSSWIFDVVVDSSDDIIVGLSYDNGDLTVGDFYAPNFSDYGFVAAKLDGDNNAWLWASVLDANLEFTWFGLINDHNDGAYFTGNFWGSITFGETIIMGDYYESFIAQIAGDTNEWLWARSGVVGNIIADDEGNIYSTGALSETTSFGDTELNPVGSTDVFVGKMNSNGEWLWAFRDGSTNSEIANKISLHNDNNVYIAGYFTTSTSLSGIPLTSNGNTDIFVWRPDVNA